MSVIYYITESSVIATDDCEALIVVYSTSLNMFAICLKNESAAHIVLNMDIVESSDLDLIGCSISNVSNISNHINMISFSLSMFKVVLSGYEEKVIYGLANPKEVISIEYLPFNL